MKTRQDAWSEENDLLLAETVLRHVREGSTQLNAFEEVGDKLNRTSAACGFRWNAVVRHQYEKALQLAKKQRKQRQRILGKDQGGKKKLLYQPPTPSFAELEALEVEVETSAEIKPETQDFSLDMQAEEYVEPINLVDESNITSDTKGDMTLEKVILFLQNLGSSHYQTDILKSENQRLKHEIAEHKQQKNELQIKVNELEKNSVTMQEDYETLMQIMNRARKLVLFDEEDRQTPTFKMDRNGNLEKMAE
ncbi:RsfA family transcriptional regulator [Bacillus spongiae]|uniref:RsfA family transcriptional regulator n=1 Tax=Bacillus spongiae TaxID=2683610 RepID=A0ABU8HI18_9BACI